MIIAAGEDVQTSAHMPSEVRVGEVGDVYQLWVSTVLRSDSCALIICSSENQEIRNVVSRNTTFSMILLVVTGNMQFDYRKVPFEQGVFLS